MPTSPPLSSENQTDSVNHGLPNMPDEYLKYLLSLNERQREAACSDISVPLMIVAGPGSGKTSTIVGRVLMLLNEGISTSNILAMTFTTAAASEMRDRIGSVTGKATAKLLTISTFHSFSLQLCRSHAEKLERRPEFLIYGHGQQRKAIIEALRLSEDEKSKTNLNVAIDGEESNGVTSPHHYASGKTPAECRRMGDVTGGEILRNYNDILKSCNALDYHDLISCSVKLLSDFPEVLKECQESWKAIVIDEFRDTSAMQYSLLRILASHNHITISIFSFNGADISGFDSFRKDFSNYKEGRFALDCYIRLNKNFRSTRYIVEAASSVIKNNKKRCQLKNVDTDNSSGSKVIIKESHNEDAQCAFVVDKILETASKRSEAGCSYGNIAILYRRQVKLTCLSANVNEVSGKVFQTALRERKIPFNVHGVAVYRKKVVRAIVAMIKTTLPGCDDGSYRQVFKALLAFEKEEKKKDSAYPRTQGAVNTRDDFKTCSQVVNLYGSLTYQCTQEQSISAVITSVANMVPQVLQYLLDDVSDFSSTHFVAGKGEREVVAEEKGCVNLLKAFIDYISERESENFHSRRHDNQSSVTLTTIHQSKGLEWDIVFIIKVNESEIPLLHEFNGVSKENGTSFEEERRLLYVAMTRARKKLFILYLEFLSSLFVVVALTEKVTPSDASTFAISERNSKSSTRSPGTDVSTEGLQSKHHDTSKETSPSTDDLKPNLLPSEVVMVQNDLHHSKFDVASAELMEFGEENLGNGFLKRFSVDERSIISHVFNDWAKKQAFQDPKRLLDKIGFVIDERIRAKNYKDKDGLRSLKSCLKDEDAFHYAQYVLRWQKIPADQRAHLMREKQVRCKTVPFVKLWLFSVANYCFVFENHLP
ncbi:unnamed protein product [Malus baccata var. baccata]